MTFLLYPHIPEDISTKPIHVSGLMNMVSQNKEFNYIPKRKRNTGSIFQVI